jgi:hypothetical protein
MILSAYQQSSKNAELIIKKLDEGTNNLILMRKVRQRGRKKVAFG